MRVLKIAATSIAMALTVGAASAASLNSVDEGWYTDDGTHDPNNANVYTAKSGSTELRSFFAFDISSLSGPVSSATFSTAAGTSCAIVDSGCFLTDTGSETMALFDVSTPAATVTGGGGGVAAFADLGTGSSYGSFTITQSSGTPMPMVSISLNAAGLADLNAAIAGLGSSFLIGGALQSITGGGIEGFYAGSNTSTGKATLTVSDVAAVPLPASLPLMAGALGLMAWRRRQAA